MGNTATDPHKKRNTMSLFTKIFGSKAENKNTKIDKKPHEILNQKFFRNLELMVEYDISIDCYCDIFETWNDKPLGSQISYSEIHPKIKQILELEFHEDICERVKNNEIETNEMESMIVKLDSDFLFYKPQLDYTKATEDDLLDKFQNGKL